MRRAAIFLVVAGCGRLSFESVGDGGSDGVASSDGRASDAPFVPPTCTPGCASGDLCRTPNGSCSGAGQCEPRPTDCLVPADPVCGCDGATYESECHALLAGVSIASTGACATTYVPNCTPACSGGFYCETPVGMCGAPGTCVAIPAPGSIQCQDVPFCGCDGLNYTGCSAAEAGMSLDYMGACGSGGT